MKVSKGYKAKLKRCEKEVHYREPGINQYAVCQASVKRVTRKDAIYRGLPKENARKVAKILKRKGEKIHVVENPYGSYDIYRFV